jgi:hypothetical protein
MSHSQISENQGAILKAIQTIEKTYADQPRLALLRAVK